MAERVRVASINDLEPGKAMEVMAGERLLALCRIGDQFYAMDGVCPHAGGPLGEGSLRGNTITCPWHGWQFNVTTGQHCLNPNIKHPCFNIVVEGENVFVELP